MSEWIIEVSDGVPNIKKMNQLVRCKDCTYWFNAEENEKGFVICPASGMEITEDDYCSYAERRSE